MRKPDSQQRKFSSRTIDGYRFVALTVLNIIVLIVVLNAGLGLLFALWDWSTTDRDTEPTTAVSCPAIELFCENGAPAKTELRTPYQLKWIDLYAYRSSPNKQHVSRVLDDFANLAARGFVYQPWVQFSEPEFRGDLVNVDTDSLGHPLRRTPHAAELRSEKIDVYVFGGSTTFGYNVADTETWPYFLSRELNARAAAQEASVTFRIHNYGRGYYEPSQEVALLMHMLRRGATPALVIFMDGVNWGTPLDQPYLTSQFVQQFEAAQFTGDRTVLELIENWPVTRLARRLSSLISTDDAATEIQPQESFSEDGLQVASRFIDNHKIASAVTAAFGIRALFFLQPDANYNYNPDLYRPALPDSVDELRPRKAQFYEALRLSGRYIDLTGLFQTWGENRKAIIDDVHYSPAFNEYVAKHVADMIDIDAVLSHSM